MRRLFLIAGLCISLAAPAVAADTVPYQQQAFQQAQAAKKPILIEIDASWCPTCAKQRPIIAKLQADPAYKDVVVMRVDFDSQKDVVRALGATTQSTLIAFHGADEKARSAGVTDEAAIRALMDKTKG